MNGTTTYAPVIITTLSRNDHFRKCIESLSKCTNAEKTDIFIGLDYPLNDSHRIGYEKILKYVETIKGFKSVSVIKRENNYGSSKNMRELKKLVLQKYDRFIQSEDDNIFSPNFLEYINIGLELYKNDPKIFAICGFRHPTSNLTIKSNIFSARVYNAWGVGFWKDKYELYYYKNFNFDYIKNVFYSFKKTTILFKNKRHIYVHRLIHSIKSNIIYGDILWNTFLVLENKYCIHPTISKVKNIGSDGTGIHCKKNSNPKQHDIDENPSFVYDHIKISESKDIVKMLKPNICGNIIKRNIIILRYLIYRLFKFDIM